MTVTIPGDVLRRALEQARMTQVELARAVHYTEAAVSRWTCGTAPLKGASAARVIEALRTRGVELDIAPACRVFFATPMAALDCPDYEQARADAGTVAELVGRVAGPVYWPGGGIAGADRFEAPDLATAANLTALERCEAFVLYQPTALVRPTSCHVELGWALAQGKPTTVFAPSEDDLPYMLRRFEAVADKHGGRYRFHPAGDAVRLLEIHGAELLGLPAAVAA